MKEYDALFEKQGGRCAICRKRSPRRKFDRDHDHTIQRETGAYVIRGLLCHRDNEGYGRFEYSDEVLVNLRTYINKTLRLRRKHIG